jgi:uncharacterized protein
MDVQPLRLNPGTDLRRELESAAAGGSANGCFVLSGIGSLVLARLRYAGRDLETTVAGPLEILTLAGSITVSGAHLHMSVSDANGQVFGGHVGYGNLIRTTAELLLVQVGEWDMSHEPDAATGYTELVVRRRPAP